MQQLIPLTPAPNQTFQVTLDIDGGTVTLNFRLHYNEIAKYWVLTILDRTGTLLLDSLPLLTGGNPSANILGQYAYLEIGSAYVVNVSGLTAPDYPDGTNLGQDFVLVWSDTAVNALGASGASVTSGPSA
jgi:hypothetical protein